MIDDGFGDDSNQFCFQNELQACENGAHTFRAACSSLVRLCSACPRVSVELVAVMYIAAFARNSKAEVIVSHAAHFRAHLLLTALAQHFGDLIAAPYEQVDHMSYRQTKGLQTRCQKLLRCLICGLYPPACFEGASRRPRQH